MNNEIIEPDVLKNRKKMPKEVKDKILNIVFFNSIFLMLMSIITLVINISFNKLHLADFRNYIKIVQMALGIISVVLFEISYKKDSMKLGFFGIEFVIFSICVLFVPYRYILKSDVQFLKISIIIFTIYYFFKVLISSLSTRHNYLKENMSDVKEIVKDDKEGYIDEESKKTLKERNQEIEKSIKNNKISKSDEKKDPEKVLKEEKTITKNKVQKIELSKTDNVDKIDKNNRSNRTDKTTNKLEKVEKKEKTESSEEK